MPFRKVSLAIKSVHVRIPQIRELEKLASSLSKLPPGGISRWVLDAMVEKFERDSGVKLESEPSHKDILDAIKDLKASIAIGSTPSTTLYDINRKTLSMGKKQVDLGDLT